MKNKTPYDIVKNRYVTEKTEVLLGLHKSESNASVRKCKTPKYAFVVDKHANKTEVASAVELIYAESKVRVVSVNIINAKKKPKVIRGRVGSKSGFKKAIVTLEAGDSLPENV
jgi:large subunit ribosomal protein L23